MYGKYEHMCCVCTKKFVKKKNFGYGASRAECSIIMYTQHTYIKFIGIGPPILLVYSLGAYIDICGSSGTPPPRHILPPSPLDTPRRRGRAVARHCCGGGDLRASRPRRAHIIIAIHRSNPPHFFRITRSPADSTPIA